MRARAAGFYEHLKTHKETRLKTIKTIWILFIIYNVCGSFIEP